MDEPTFEPSLEPVDEPLPATHSGTGSNTAQRFSFDRSDVVAVLAVMISLVALGVSVYEAKILHDQKGIMFEQQKAAVWPYLRDEESFVYDTSFTYVYGLENKGVGPAIVEQAELWLNKELITDYQDLYRSISKVLPDSMAFVLSYGNPKGFILSPGETFEALRIECPIFDRNVPISELLSFQLRLCYRSVYGDGWTIGLGGDWPLEGCELD